MNNQHKYPVAVVWIEGSLKGRAIWGKENLFCYTLSTFVTWHPLLWETQSHVYMALA